MPTYGYTANPRLLTQEELDALAAEQLAMGGSVPAGGYTAEPIPPPQEMWQPPQQDYNQWGIPVDSVPPPQPGYVATDLGYDANYVPPPGSSPNMSTAAQSVSPGYDQPRSAPNMTTAAMSVSPYADIPEPAYTGGAWSPTDTMRPPAGNWVGPFNMDEWGPRAQEFLTAGVPASQPNVLPWLDENQGASWQDVRDPGSWLPEPQQDYDRNGNPILGMGEAAFVSGPVGRPGAGMRARGVYEPGINRSGGVVTQGGKAAVQGPGLNPSGSIARGGRQSVAGGTYQIPPPNTIPAISGAAGKVDAFGEPLWTEPVEAAAMGMTADDYAVLRGMTGNRPVRSGGRAYTAPIPAPGAAGDVYASRIAAAEAEAAALRAARGASAAEAGVPIPPPTAGTGAGGRPIFAPSGRVVNLTVTGRVGTGGRGAAPPTTPSAAGPK